MTSLKSDPMTILSYEKISSEINNEYENKNFSYCNDMILTEFLY